MKASDRREKIMKELAAAGRPVSATALAGKFSVSRQIIVGDIALLRAAGEDISATPRGYILDAEQAGSIIRKIACRHNSPELTEKELQICVDNGCKVVDVIVEHPVYGQITGELMLQSRYDVAQFMKRIAENGTHSLSELTDGIHLHTLECPDTEAFDRVCKELAQAGIMMT